MKCGGTGGKAEEEGQEVQGGSSEGEEKDGGSLEGEQGVYGKAEGTMSCPFQMKEAFQMEMARSPAALGQWPPSFRSPWPQRNGEDAAGGAPSCSSPA